MSYSGLVKQLLGGIYSRLTHRQFTLDHTHILEWLNAIFTTVWLFKSLMYAYDQNDGFHLNIYLDSDKKNHNGRDLEDPLDEGRTMQ